MLRKSLLCLSFCCAFASIADAQLVEIERVRGKEDAARKFENDVPRDSVGSSRIAAGDPRFKLFAREGVTFETTGSTTANIQIAKLHIGSPKGFHFPLYLFSSPADRIGDGDDGDNDQVASQLLNPIGGALNVSINKSTVLAGAHDSYSSLRLAYHVAAKLIAGKDLADPTKSLGTCVGFCDLGLLLQTGAWKDGAGKNEIGVFWIQGKLGAIRASRKRLERWFDEPGIDAWHTIWSVSGGLEIDNYINLKFAVTQPFASRNIEVFKEPMVRMGFDVTPRMSPLP